MSQDMNSIKKENLIKDDRQFVYKHEARQSNEVKWLFIEEVYSKLHRASYFDIGGTYNLEGSHLWFLFKTEIVGSLFLIHIFVTNRSEDPVTIQISSSSQISVDKKTNNVYLPSRYKTYNLYSTPVSYFTTYNFTNLDVEIMKDKNLCIPIAISDTKVKQIELENNMKVYHDLSAMLTDPVGTDFTIASADGDEFKVHKILLSASSDVFKAMLKEDTAESQNNYVKIDDVVTEDLKYILEFIYTGTVKDIESSNCLNMLMLADRYNLKGLQDLTEHVLSLTLTLENALQILVISDMYNSDNLKLSVFKFIKNNVSILRDQSFNKISNAALIRELCTYLAS